MRKIAIEIECENEKCGECRKLKEDRDCYLYCEEFGDDFKEHLREECLRLPECLNAEVKE